MKKSTSLWNRASYWTACMGVAAVLLGATSNFVLDRFVKESVVFTNIGQSSEIRDRYDSHYEDIENAVEALEAQISSLSAVPQDIAVSAKLMEIESRLDKVGGRVDAIDKAIMQSPEKALEIPMLKRDFQALQRQHEDSVAALEREITRAYDTNKWVIGTIVFGILGLAASVFLRERGSDE